MRRGHAVTGSKFTRDLHAAARALPLASILHAVGARERDLDARSLQSGIERAAELLDGGLACRATLIANLHAVLVNGYGNARNRGTGNGRRDCTSPLVTRCRSLTTQGRIDRGERNQPLEKLDMGRAYRDDSRDTVVRRLRRRLATLIGCGVWQIGIGRRQVSSS